MKKYIKSIAVAVIAFGLIILLNFALPRLMPGDPVHYLTGIDEEVLNEAQYDYYYQELGLNLPVSQQFGRYMKSLFDGTLGYSYHYETTVAQLLKSRIPATLQIVLPAIVISSLLALWLGLLAGSKAGRRLDGFLSSSAVVINAVPAFLLAMALIIIFSLKLGWLPYGNLSSAIIGEEGAFADRIGHLVLPVATLVIATTPSKYLLMRNSAAQAAREKYMVYANAKGLSFRRVRLRHLFPNVCQPFVAAVGMNIGAMLAGSVVVETVFSINGMGMLVSEAITDLDYPLLQGCLFVIACAVIVASVLTDAVCILTDPKARYGETYER